MTMDTYMAPNGMLAFVAEGHLDPRFVADIPEHAKHLALEVTCVETGDDRAIQPPAGGWTPETLLAVKMPFDCWEAYLNGNWLGSSEC
jgi:hypothetical protein